MLFPGFIGATYSGHSLNVDAERAVNLYAEAQPPSAKAPFVYYGTPGLGLYHTLPQTPVRGLVAGEDRLFAAAGTKLYEVFNTVPTTRLELGTIADDASHSPVQMFFNGSQLFVVSAGKAYLHTGLSLAVPAYADAKAGTVRTANVAGAYSEAYWETGDKFDPSMNGKAITIDGNPYTVEVFFTPELIWVTPNTGSLAGVPYSGDYSADVTARSGAFLDNYFIVNPPGTRNINISAIANGLSWDALDYEVKEGYPDSIVRILAHNRELWLLGRQTSELWRNIGNADFPFRRDDNGLILHGCGAAWSAVSLPDGPAWLGADTEGQTVAWYAKQFEAMRISTHAVEQAWRAYSTIADAIGHTYQEDAHDFWELNFPTANATWVYDATTNMWHERAWWNGAANVRQRQRCHAYVFGRHLVGDWENGNIYEQSLSFYTDNGTTIRRVRRAPHLFDEDIPHFYYRAALDHEAGVGLNPTFAWSDDGGHTFTTPRVADTLDAVGEYGRRIIWRRLGRALKSRTFELTITDAVKVVLMGMFLRVTKGKPS